MQKNKLRKFIIYSVAFHIILISLILLYFYKNPITINSGKSGNLMIGVIKSEDLYIGNTSSDADQRDQDTLKKLDKEQSNKPATALKQTSANEIVENSKETNKIMQATIDNKSKEKSSNSKRESVSETQTISNFDIETKTAPHIGKGPDSRGIPGSQGNAGDLSENADYHAAKEQQGFLLTLDHKYSFSIPLYLLYNYQKLLANQEGYVFYRNNYKVD